jgi:hypothetical protein
MNTENMKAVIDILERIPVPQVYRIRQTVPSPTLDNVETEVTSRLRTLDLLKKIKKGWTVAIAVGSRGISNQDTVVRVLVEHLKRIGATPFIVPAMGSHAAANADHQREMLEGLGISEASVGAPIRSSMDVVQIGTSASGLPVYVDKNAYSADGIVLVNRIKAHTAFVGPVQSGLLKMAVIGLGKQRGAEVCHELGFAEMSQRITEIAEVSFAKLPILFGIGLIENANHDTAEVHILEAKEIPQREPELLKRALELIARVPFAKVDAMIVDRIGKEISGSGMDSNVTGRYHTGFGSGGPEVTRIAVLDISEASHNNGTGLGIADVTTYRAFQKFDFGETYPNILTSNTPISVKIPMVLPNDRNAIQGAIKTCLLGDKSKTRLVRIKDTLHVGEMEVSATLLDEVEANSRLEVLEGPYDLPFDENGDLF